jgi:peptidoglycan/LPS O-acetylase OafA/YrhL
LTVAVVLEPELLRAPKQLTANALLLQNYVPSYIFGAGVVPAWSLAIEVVFYLAVPVLGGLAIRAARRGGMSPFAASLLPVAAMVAIGFAAKVGARVLEGDADRIWELTFFAHADWFAAGMAVAALRVRWERRGGTLPRAWRPLAAVVAAVLVAVAAGLYYPGTLSYLEYQTPIAVACALVLCLVVFPSGRSRVLPLLESRPMVAAGLASYSLFLWHDPLLRAFRDAGWTFDGRGGFVVNLLVVGAVSAVASAVTYRFVEKPALAMKRRWQTPAHREGLERGADLPAASPASSAP